MRIDNRLLGVIVVAALAAAFAIGVGIGAHGKYSKDQLDKAVAAASTPPSNGHAATLTLPVQNTVTQVAQKPYTSFGDGVWQVGVDIKPGIYKTDGNSMCVYERLSGYDSTKDFIDGNSTNGPAIVEIMASDKVFESTHCGTWVLQQ